MRDFSTDFKTKLASTTYYPVVFVEYTLTTYVSGNTPGTGQANSTFYFWSERDIRIGTPPEHQDYEARIVNTAPLESGLDNLQGLSEMGLQLSNHAPSIASAIMAGMQCTVWMGFEDSVGSGTVTDAEIIFVGVVDGDIEITEDSVSFQLTDIANSYDRQIPPLISRDEFPLADPDAIGDTMPIIMGRTNDLECRPVAVTPTATLIEDYEEVWPGWGVEKTAAGSLGSITKTDDLKKQGVGHVYVTDPYHPETVKWNNAGGIDVYPAGGDRTVRIDWTTNTAMYAGFATGDRYWLSVCIDDNSKTSRRVGSIFARSTSANQQYGFSYGIAPRGNVANLGTGSGGHRASSSGVYYGVDFTIGQHSMGLWEIELVLSPGSDFQILGVWVHEIESALTTEDRVYVSEDIGWWRGAYSGISYPELKMVSYGTWENYKEDADVQAAYTNKPHLSYSESIAVSAIGYEASSGSWYVDLTEKMKYTHRAGEVVYLDDKRLGPDPTLNKPDPSAEYQIFLVADHPVKQISNVKVNGSPVGRGSSKYEAYLYNYCPYIDGSSTQSNPLEYPEEKAYIAISLPKVRHKSNVVAGVSGGGGSIEDTIDVDDSIDVDDTIVVDDQTHDHTTAATSYWNYQISGTWQASGLGSGGVRIVMRHGVAYRNAMTVVLQGNGKFLNSMGTAPNYLPISIIMPWSFTSSALNIYLNIDGFGTGYFSHLSFQASRTDPLTGNVTYAMGVQNGNLMHFNFPAPPGASKTGKDPAKVFKVGDAKKAGEAIKTGTVTLSNQTGSSSSAGNTVVEIQDGSTEIISASDYIDVRSKNVVTCDVVGYADPTFVSNPVLHHQNILDAVHPTPQNMIKNLINLYARNPLYGNERDADIVEFSDYSTAETYFGLRYNSISGDGASTDATNDSSYHPIVPNYEEGEAPPPTSPVVGYYPSPYVQLGNSHVESFQGAHVLDFAVTEPQRLRDVVSDMLFHSNMTLFWRNGIAQLKHHPKTPVIDQYLYESDSVMGLTTVSRSSDAELATEIEVRYDYSPEKDYRRNYEHLIKTGTGANLSKIKLDATRRFGSKSSERLYDFPMIRDQVATELVAERLFDDYGSSKYRVGLTTALKHLALEPGDDLEVVIPMFDGSVIGGVLENRTLSIGSAIDRQPDLIAVDIRENHVAEGVYRHRVMSPDTVSISDSISVVLNDANRLFGTLSDSFSLSDSIHIHPFCSFSESVGITESVAFEYQAVETDLVSLDDSSIGFTGILFWAQQPSDAFGLSDNAITALQDGVYVPLVYTDTDTVNVGVFI